MSKEKEMLKDGLFVINSHGDVEELALNDSDKLLQRLEKAKANDEYISGKVTGVEMLDKEGPMIASLYMGDFRVIIPYEVFVDKDIVEQTNSIVEARYIMKKRLGSFMDFKIVAIDVDKKVIVGNRVEAMKQKRDSFWFRKNKNSDSYFIDEGSLVQARVVTVDKKWIAIEVLGIEQKMFSQDISYVRVYDLNEYYKAGDDIVVKVTSVSRDEDNKIVDVSFSIKDLKENPILTKINRFNAGDIYIGKVSMIDRHGVYVAIDGGVEILCKLPKKEKNPILGSDVTVIITNINKEQYRLFGIITDVSSVL